jgi:hypothetical protein
MSVSRKFNTLEQETGLLYISILRSWKSHAHAAHVQGHVSQNPSNRLFVFIQLSQKIAGCRLDQDTGIVGLLHSENPLLGTRLL